MSKLIGKRKSGLLEIGGSLSRRRFIKASALGRPPAWPVRGR